MLGNTAKTDAQKEIERQQIERAMQGIRQILEQMRGASPGETERMHQRIKDACTDKRLDMDFKRKAMEQARACECNANMRATDERLRDAMRMATGEHMKERGAALADARRYYGKACTLGADEEFRKAAQRLIDTIMMSGGVVHAGPTRAKPLDTAPKAPNRAKEFNAPTEPEQSPEQLHALFQELLHKIPLATSRRQLEEATDAALQLMLRRAGDKDLLASQRRKVKEVAESVPDPVHGEKGAADLKRAAQRCLDILKESKRLRKPRIVQFAGRARDESHTSRNLILGVGLVALVCLGGLWLYHANQAPQEIHGTTAPAR